MRRRSAAAVALGAGLGCATNAFVAPSLRAAVRPGATAPKGVTATPGASSGAASATPTLCATGALAAMAAAVTARQVPRKAGMKATATADATRRGAAVEDCSGDNPAVCWPAGKPCYTTEYPEEYDLKDPKGSFKRVGKMLLKEMIEELPEFYEMPQKEVDWVTRSLEYNTQGGKMNRGLIVVETGVAMLKHQGKTPTNADLNRFAVLGWAVEFLQACMLMADDMMDGSVTRRGAPCWYKLENVGLLNTNDFLMVEMFVYKIIKRHFGQEPYFLWLVDLFLETTFQTEVGQLLDSICANCELEELDTTRWELVVKYKTAFYSFYLPVALAMLVTGCRDRKAYDTSREALLLMGVYFQAQDDYLDAFASPEVLGKIGTDIADKKCSWLFAHAYHEFSTPEGKAYLDEHYGKCKVGSDEEAEIKKLYTKLGLEDLFAKYEGEIEGKLAQYKERIEACDLPWSVFEMFFALIHKRSK
jgi:farnesyl diphosphate synthase